MRAAAIASASELERRVGTYIHTTAMLLSINVTLYTYVCGLVGNYCCGLCDE